MIKQKSNMKTKFTLVVNELDEYKIYKDKK